MMTDCLTKEEAAVKEESAASEAADHGGPLASPADSAGRTLLQSFTAVIHAHGGAQQYLLCKYPTVEARVAFAATLSAMLPKAGNVEYHDSCQCPQHEDDVVLHLKDLGFDMSCTTKPPPYKTVCLALGEEIITNGLLTKGPSRAFTLL